MEADRDFGANGFLIEPPKKKRGDPYTFPLNPGCLMTGSLFHGLGNNPHIPG